MKYISTKINVPNLYYNDSVAFLFMVTRDLVKEHIWKKWFESLPINYNIYVHCSDPTKIKSEWLKKYLIPYNIPTTWNSHMEAELTLYRYALKNTNDSWFINLSETTVPYISPKKFSTFFRELKTKSMLTYKRPWWSKSENNRANLLMFPPDARFGNNEWCVLCNEDVRTIMYLWDYTPIVKTMIDGPHADESIFSVSLYIGNNFKNNIKTDTTIIDWERTTNYGNSPHVFTDWDKEDKKFVKDFVEQNPYTMFIRKVSPDFPDSVILKWTKL